MPNDNMYDQIPNAVATIVTSNTGWMFGTNINHEERQKQVLDFADKLTRTMVAAIAERDKPTFGK
jgi:hypothetical protein